MQTDQLAMEIAEHNSAAAWNAWDESVKQLDAQIAQPLKLVPLVESEEQRNARLLSSPLVLSLANEAERRCAEAARVRADLRINAMKSSGEYHRRESDRALRDQVANQPTNDLGLWA